jgi:nickel-dependent lactate racemase
MSHRFHVNVGKEWAFEVDDASLVASVGGPNGATCGDASSLIRDALASPIDFPSLASATVPGDQIAVAVDPLLPDPSAALRGVGEALRRAGAEDERITFVIPVSLAGLADSCRWDTASLPRGRWHYAVHDPANRADLAYLAATSGGQPIYLNRHLCDADLLIPVTCVPPPASPRWFGIHGSIYPTFSDAQTHERFRIGPASTSAARHGTLRAEVDEVGWLLGVCVVLGVVPGPDGTIYRAAAGTPQRALDHCVGIATAAWQGELSRRVPLVIALVGRGNGDLAWDDFAAALASASMAADEDGAVAVCGDFTKGPGRSLRRLVGAADLQAVANRLQGESHEDTWAAQELAAALARGPVFFAGRLSDEQVENLGMAPIGGPEEITRLASRLGECVVIRDAQLTAPRLAEALDPVT